MSDEMVAPEELIAKVAALQNDNNYLSSLLRAAEEERLALVDQFQQARTGETEAKKELTTKIAAIQDAAQDVSAKNDHLSSILRAAEEERVALADQLRQALASEAEARSLLRKEESAPDDRRYAAAVALADAALDLAHAGERGPTWSEAVRKWIAVRRNTP